MTLKAASLPGQLSYLFVSAFKHLQDAGKIFTHHRAALFLLTEETIKITRSPCLVRW